MFSLEKETIDVLMVLAVFAYGIFMGDRKSTRLNSSH